MLKRILKRNLRQPLKNLVVLLFAAVLTVTLCWLHRAAEEEQKSLEAAYASVPVFFKVTDLDGSKVSTTNGIEGWVYDLFTERGMKPNLAPYVRDIHMRVPYSKGMWQYSYVELAGITSTYVAEELTEDWGGEIHWNEGFDESCLRELEYVVIVPELLKEHKAITMNFSDSYMYGDAPKQVIFDMEFQVAGYYIDPGNTTFYCSISAVEDIYAKMHATKPIQRLGAILNDNYQLDRLRETSANWFAEPNPMGELTEWGKYDFDYYLYALEINDAMLKSLETSMKNSLRMNQMAAAIVFVLSAGAGFLVGFLVVRSRKREIVLMRTMGVSQLGIYLELALEQLVCIIAGILLGGGYVRWQPVGQLCLFGGIYLVGLTAAMLAFLRINLLSVMKEDE